MTIQLGRSRLASEGLAKLTHGTLVVLEQDVNEPVEIYANDRLVARGEILVSDNRFCVQVTELITHVNAIA